MADERRNRAPGRSPRGRSGPGGSRSSAPSADRRAQRDRVVAEAATRTAAKAEEKRRTRLTGRAAVLVLVLAVLAVSYASSLRAYLQQRSQIDAVEAQIAERESAIDSLEREKERWTDPAFVAQQARARFGYVARGETPYVVVDKDGNPLDATVELSDPDSVGQHEEPAWYDEMWASTEVAGNPPTRIPDPPRKKITAPAGDLGE
ncbi:septum formation initiator family protein [Nocardioides sp. GY 10113]|uniref:FtsB family cell division protein n=1 Tax=Nocardioides sp. GY 10113 TaxID=2569761 RepID=UPI0010A8AB83|nr:septum formation initiator family protein [Nocardioides sp. GY 10113]TIC87368.1 septum formation initiator family protein [Nocardioides sp. GY 10113]